MAGFAGFLDIGGNQVSNEFVMLMIGDWPLLEIVDLYNNRDARFAYQTVAMKETQAELLHYLRARIPGMQIISGYMFSDCLSAQT